MITSRFLTPLTRDDENDARQRELIGPRQKLAQYRESFRGAVRRITPKELTDLLGYKDADVLRHQVNEWSPRKHPSADAAFFAQYLDLPHAQEVAQLGGRLLVKPAKLKPQDALRTLMDRASARGFVAQDEIMQLAAQTDFVEDDSR